VPRSGDAEIGVLYPVELYTHGGIRFVTFRRRSWQAETASTCTGRLTGTMELLAPDRLRFTALAPEGFVVLFRPSAGTAPLDVSSCPSGRCRTGGPPPSWSRLGS
jgi:hypothetical protein